MVELVKGRYSGRVDIEVVGELPGPRVLGCGGSAASVDLTTDGEVRVLMADGLLRWLVNSWEACLLLAFNQLLSHGIRYAC